MFLGIIPKFTPTDCFTGIHWEKLNIAIATLNYDELFDLDGYFASRAEGNIRTYFFTAVVDQAAVIYPAKVLKLEQGKRTRQAGARVLQDETEDGRHPENIDFHTANPFFEGFNLGMSEVVRDRPTTPIQRCLPISGMRQRGPPHLSEPSIALLSIPELYDMRKLSLGNFVAQNDSKWIQKHAYGLEMIHSCVSTRYMVWMEYLNIFDYTCNRHVARYLQVLKIDCMLRDIGGSYRQD
ncbi:hypothetical protein BJ508DRAFT_378009 [Ascobolus immersus RN42]|uniref:Uncharacterized protein n=1 Tax=Ascobolus immersus RN42 TaxID=1160509 RepID=A0A3N4HYH7_ASCIM|nr:hypothetical protein BJ508DRAFT_378009 [Ascobolus immersus RN42]